MRITGIFLLFWPGGFGSLGIGIFSMMNSFRPKELQSIALGSWVLFIAQVVVVVI
jgi:hypothetical protein